MVKRWPVKAHAWLSVSLSIVVRERSTVLRFASQVIIQRSSKKLAQPRIATLMMMLQVLLPARELIILSYFVKLILCNGTDVIEYF